MSVCFNHVRRTIGASVASKQRMSALSPNLIAPIIATSILSSAAVTATIPTRHFAAAKKGGDQKSVLSYQDRKDAAKEKRRDTYNAKHDRLERLKTRRDHSEKDAKKILFRSWWDKEVMYHNILDRKARQQGKPWRIRVAVMVERIPIVTPDVEEWEREYWDLRDYIWTYGKEYPEDTGFMPPDKPEDHIVPTDEELLAGLPFTPAPRETEADTTGNVKTRDRELKTSVFLGIKTDAEGNKNGSRWTLPSALAQSDETLLETAKRAVSGVVGEDLGLWCPSNAPMTVNFRVYNKNLPEDFRKNYYGEKIFYYRVQHDNGDVDEKALKADDWGWLTKGEIVERVEEERSKHEAKFFSYML
mmetsp:Transcript_11022/g.24306  ORF Transcript_11022/g.24306 Transcript_11022/m.24306 type:complete len:359 (+) Transcript_11022:133-1209(+)|eukprot:CAMPEP_0172325632 /NCGR_PEP_ID=MMETSP1058-20130122/54468_1 /TAXON_ID=83371 /ORGANISM="Detonula confervacea, Strain CCMP 353" /LENGTH=358 /DNA_ID=CAMNT_0013042223 /DNA_START=115 /DNA_END=1191 /DNA_ORIENTATION=+